MPVADTHAHLYWKDYQEVLDQVITAAYSQGIRLIINIGVDLKTSQQSLNQVTGKIDIYSTIGIHPHEGSILLTDESIHQNIGELEKLYQSASQKIVGIGECGLDYYFPTPNQFNPSNLTLDQLKLNQMKLYKAQILLAKKLNLPLIIHCRDAWSDIFVPELSGTTGLFHSFTGSEKDAKRVMDLGYYLAFSCIITYPKNDNLRQVISQTPLDKILTETDCPFLPPQSIRGQRNEPQYVVETVKIVAQMKNMSFEEAAQSTFENAGKLFKLK